MSYRLERKRQNAGMQAPIGCVPSDNDISWFHPKPGWNGCLVFYLVEERWFVVPVMQITLLHLFSSMAEAMATFRRGYTNDDFQNSH